MADKRSAPKLDNADSERAPFAESERDRPGTNDSEDIRPEGEGEEPDEADDDEERDEADDDEERDEDDEERDEDDEERDEDNDERRSEAQPSSASLLGLRPRTWLLLGGALALGGYYVLDNYEPPTQAPEIGDVVRADITLVTADRKDLDCMAASGIGAYQCGFASETTPNKVDERHRLRPFMTLDRTLYLIPGLFLEPAVETRYKAEPPDKPREQLRRFTAKCRLKLAGTLNGVRLRWRPGSAWQPRTNGVRVGTVSGCKIVPHQPPR